MFRAFFRRLTLGTTLVVLLSVSLLGALPVQAKSNAILGPCGGSGIGIGKFNFSHTHCAVAFTVAAPSGTTTIGASTYMEVWDPTVVGPTVSNNDYSIAQVAIFNGSPDNYGATYTKDIEVGWIVDPSVWPNVQGPPQPHLFVFVRDSNKTTDSDQNCFVQLDVITSQWSCGFGAYYTSPVLPGDQLNVTPGDVKPFVIVYSNGNWFIQYDYSWIGYISGSWFTDSTGTFDHVSYAQWQGEVASTSLQPTTQMGNGYCGSKTSPVPAHFYTMQVATYTQAIDAWTLSSTHRATATNPKLYNGKPTTSSTGSTLSYGGPTGCP